MWEIFSNINIWPNWSFFSLVMLSTFVSEETIAPDFLFYLKLCSIPFLLLTPLSSGRRLVLQVSVLLPISSDGRCNTEEWLKQILEPDCLDSDSDSTPKTEACLEKRNLLSDFPILICEMPVVGSSKYCGKSWMCKTFRWCLAYRMHLTNIRYNYFYINIIFCHLQSRGDFI